MAPFSWPSSALAGDLPPQSNRSSEGGELDFHAFDKKNVGKRTFFWVRLRQGELACCFNDDFV